MPNEAEIVTIDHLFRAAAPDTKGTRPWCPKKAGACPAGLIDTSRGPRARLRPHLARLGENAGQRNLRISPVFRRAEYCRSSRFTTGMST